MANSGLVCFALTVTITVIIFIILSLTIFEPNQIKVYVESANLTQFNLSASSNLQYDLTLDMSVRNPNKTGIYYDYVEAQALFAGSRFGFANISDFYQGHKNTTMLHPEFKGQQLLLGDPITTYSREKGEGHYYIDVKLYIKLRLKVWIFKFHHLAHIDCSLELPVPGSNGSMASFQRTKCHVSTPYRSSSNVD